MAESVSAARTIDIVCVDNNLIMADRTATLLKRSDGRFTVETATSPENGLRLISDQSPECIVSEYAMAGTDGLEFLRAVREEHPELPFILYTDEGSEMVASNAIAAGVTDYLPKDSESDQHELLATRIRDAVESRREKQRPGVREELTRLTEYAGSTGGFKIDLDTGDVTTTDGADRLLDLPENENLTLENAVDLYHPEDRPAIRQAINRAVENGERTEGTWRYHLPGGEKKLLEVTFVPPTADENGRTIRGAVHDATDHKRRRRELEQIETLFEHSQDSLFLVDATGAFTLERVNPAYEDATGLSAESIRGRTLRDVFGEDGAAMERRYDECVDRREALQYDEHIEIEGQLTHWETRIAPVVLDGTVEYVVGSTRNVTEQVERREELKAERRFIEQTLDSLDDLFYVLDVDGTLRRWNDRVPEITGYSDSELKRIEAIDLFPEDERAAITDAIGSTISGNEMRVEADLLVADGRHVPYEFTGSPLTDGAGNMTGIVGVGRDLTERRERERRFRALVENSSDVISIVGRDGQFQYLSPSIERILGYSPEDVVGDTAWEYIHPDDRERVAAQFGNWVNDPDRTSGVIEYRTRHADGTWRWMEARGNDQLDEPAVDGLVINSRDITERKERQQQLRVFDRVLRHNLRNDVNVIRGEAEVIRSEAEVIRSEASNGMADRASRIVEMSDQLMDIAEEEREISALLRKSPQRRTITVEPLLRDVATGTKRNHPEATIAVDCPEEAEILATRRFRRAIEELVTNAVVHNDTPSPEVTVSVTRADETIRIEVADNGPPIPERERNVLLKPTDRTPVNHATGLGLWLVKLIVSRSGGTISFDENTPTGNVVGIDLQR